MIRTELLSKLVGSGNYGESEVREALELLGEALQIVPFDLAQSDLTAESARTRLPNLRVRVNTIR